MDPDVGAFFSALALAASHAFPAQATDIVSQPPLEGVASGVVESVREIQLDGSHSDLANVFEHPLKPMSAAQLVVRFDDGRAILLCEEDTQRLQPGQRVRVFSGTGGTRVQRE